MEQDTKGIKYKLTSKFMSTFTKSDLMSYCQCPKRLWLEKHHPDLNTSEPDEMIIANGKVVTDGTPADLEGQSPNHNTVVLTVRGGDVYAIQAQLAKIDGVSKTEELGQDGELRQFRVFPDKGRWIIADVGQCAREQQWEVAELHVDRGQLDEVFRSLTAPKQALT